MNISNKIKKIEAYSILDSRGMPTIECSFTLDSNETVITGIPSGASTGSYEVPELRDNDPKKQNGHGVTHAIEIINQKIGPLLCDRPPDLAYTDQLLNQINQSEYHGLLGSNTMLALSLSTLKAMAINEKLPLHQYISTYTKISSTDLPRIVANLINGGMHAKNGLTWQEYSLVNTDSTSEDSIDNIVAIYQLLKQQLREKRIPLAVGDEGGFAAFKMPVEHEVPLKWLSQLIDELQLTDKLGLAIDAAASTWYDPTSETYQLDTKKTRSNELLKLYKKTIQKYGLLLVEDPFAEKDLTSWKKLVQEIDQKTVIIGDDLFASQKKRLENGAQNELARGLILKPNQVGTMSALFETALFARNKNLPYVLSHRSGETLDASIVDIAIGLGAWGLKCGAPARGERIAKYNRFLQILKNDKK
jgi:enolase